MTRWKSLNRPKSSGFRYGRMLATSIGSVRPLFGEMLYEYNRPIPVIDRLYRKQSLVEDKKG